MMDATCGLGAAAFAGLALVRARGKTHVGQGVMNGIRGLGAAASAGMALVRARGKTHVDPGSDEWDTWARRRRLCRAGVGAGSGQDTCGTRE